jgi:hypothetical protein
MRFEAGGNRHQREPSDAFGLERIDEVGNPTIPFTLIEFEPIAESSAGNDDVCERIVGTDRRPESAAESGLDALLDA